MKRIGFTGLGIMGTAMSRNVMKAGYELNVYNRTAERMKPLVDEGAKPCRTPAEVGKNSELVVVCVSDAPDVEAVVMGPDGVAQGMTAGGIIVDCSTSSPQLARNMAETLEQRGIGVLDAPVSGGPEGAKNATLAIMVGGDEETFNKALPVLEAMGKSIVLVGPAGAGQLTKAINQIIVATHLEAVAEGIALAKKSGIDAEKVFQAISGGAAASWVMKMRSPSMLEEKFTPPNFTLALHAKDLRLAIEAAKDCGAKLDVAERIHAILQSLVEKNCGSLDHSALYLYTKEMNNL